MPSGMTALILSRVANASEKLSLMIWTSRRDHHAQDLQEAQKDLTGQPSGHPEHHLGASESTQVMLRKEK